MVAANSRKVMAVVKEVVKVTVKKAVVKKAVVKKAAVKEAAVKEAVEGAAEKKDAVKEAACNWKELDLKDEMMSMKWPTVMQKDCAHEIQCHDVLVCVWYVHLCCKSVGYSMGT